MNNPIVNNSVNQNLDAFMGIDLGTQSIKVSIYQAGSKTLLASVSEAISLDQDSSGKAEQSADEWLRALDLCMQRLPIEARESVVALAVSGQQHGLVALDADDKVIAPVKLWCDNTTAAECEEIMQAMGGADACRERVGNALIPAFTAPKIRWLKNHKPDIYQRLATVLLPHDYLNFHLTGEKVMEYGDASGTGMLNIRNRAWDENLLAALDSERNLARCLPSLVSAKARIGTVRSSLAQAWGLSENVLVAPGGGDNMMAAIGTGNVTDQVVSMSLGSSGTVYAHSSQPVLDPSGELAAFCSSTDGWLPLLCIINCTLSTELVRQLFQCDLEQMEAAISATPVGAKGVLCLPFFNGERTPSLPTAKGSFLGLDATNCQVPNLLRATMEGATYGLRIGVEALKRQGVNVAQIRLTGGGSKSASWRQMVADVCNLPVILCEPDEGAAFGAALQALYVYRAQQENKIDLQALVDEHIQPNPNKQHQPIPAHVTSYAETFRHYQRAVAALGPYYTNFNH